MIARGARAKDLLNRKTQYILLEKANKMKTRAHNLLKSRRAVSAVISNLILIAAVIAVGFAVIVWAQSTSSNYTNQYGQAINTDINQLQERIALEACYNSTPTTLNAYLINSGKVNVTIQTVYVSSQSGNPTPYSFKLYTFQNQLVPSNTLNATTGMREGYVSITLPNPLSGGSYSLRIITAGGSAFVFTFAV
jgi:hypothetical protein